MILAGFGMVMGNLISGRLSDRYTPGKVGTAAQALICIMLLLIFFLSPYKWAAALLMCLLYGRTVRSIQSGADINYPRIKGRRNAGEQPACRLHSISEMPSVLMQADWLLAVATVIRLWRVYHSP